MPMTVELFHSAFSSVAETTYFGIEFIRSAKPTSSVTDGHAAANPSYVTRPSSCASAAMCSSNLNLSPSAPRLNLNVHPACSKSPAGPGDSNTPSSETNSVTTILPMCRLHDESRRAKPGSGGSGVVPRASRASRSSRTGPW